MARISGVDVPNEKPIWIALTYIYGVGRTRSRQILEKAQVDPARRTHELSEDELLAIRRVIDSDYTVEGELRQQVAMNIKRMMDLGSWRGLRHRKGLPVRGQRTRTNARTRKGRAKR